MEWDNLEALARQQILAGHQASVSHQALAGHQALASHQDLAGHQASASHQTLAGHQASANHQALVYHKVSASNQASAVLCVLIPSSYKSADRGRGTDKGRGTGKGKGSGRGTGRGRGKRSVSDQQLGEKRTIWALTSSVGQKRSKTVGFGIFIDQMSGSKTLNPGTRGETVVTPGVYKDATQINIDIDYKPRGMKWKERMLSQLLNCRV
ncbi:hypothetical protein CQW23_17808 [Capsicum baccatum]|uniref:Uncharacterized protein n=1 Tax=Capsicum baccatum TaxID=33114 RepID=A0A2G2WEX1_CAPBA|nr:hypothetical protein CQW23_17808 [Capsicum baccatum]